jgi:hypothetical protein
LNPVIIRPHLISLFGATEGSTFCLVTNSEIIDQFKIEESDAYCSYMSVGFNNGDSFDNILKQVIPESAHILVISPHSLFEPPLPEKIGPRRKLIAMPSKSTPAHLDEIADFLGTMESLIFVSPDTQTLNQSVETPIGSTEPQVKRGFMQRKKSSSCPCQY